MARLPKNQIPIYKIAAEVDLLSYHCYQDYLQAVYLKAKEAIPRYSYQKFSEALGFRETSYSYLVITGKRQPSKEGVSKIVKSLHLKKEKRLYFLSLLSFQTAKTEEEKDAALKDIYHLKHKCLTRTIDRDQFEYFGQWYIPIIREMVQLPDFKPDPQWIAQRITPEITEEQAVQGLEALKRLNLIEFDFKKGKFVLREPSLTTDHNITSTAILKYQTDLLSIGKGVLNSMPMNQREISNLTLCLSHENANKIKRMIDEFTDQLLAEEQEDPKKDQVFQYNFQFFPVTKSKGS